MSRPCGKIEASDARIAWVATFVSAAMFCIPGCHSAYVRATVQNQGPSPITLVEVDYPNASFGTNSIAPSAQFTYRFKVQETGPVKLQYTDSQGKAHQATGPDLHAGQEGQITICVNRDNSVTWTPGP